MEILSTSPCDDSCNEVGIVFYTVWLLLHILRMPSIMVEPNTLTTLLLYPRCYYKMRGSPQEYFTSPIVAGLLSKDIARDAL